jgi:hypothetical protein
MLKGFLLACCLALSAASAQEWYVGGTGGYSFTPDISIKSPAGSANTGFNSGGAFGAFFGDDMYNYWGGEVRYLYQQTDLKLSGSGQSVHFGAHQNIIHADFLGHFRPRESRVRPFVAFGAGIRFIQGTGSESASQPLGEIAALTHTSESLPVADFGAGLKFNFRKSWQLRVEVRDYLSPSPNKVVIPDAGGSISGWFNNIVGMGSIAYTF